MRTYSPGGILTAFATALRAIAPNTWYSSFTAWTTRVSNPVCSPRFRASASVTVQQAAFATGVLPDLYAFYRYTRNSACPSCTPALQFQKPLHPVNPDNACTIRITAAAGTYLAGASYSGTVIPSSLLIELYIPKYFFTHAASLHQGSPHCAISPTAASRRSLGRLSVPMWPVILSDRLLIVALVGRYLTNWLIRRGAIFLR